MDKLIRIFAQPIGFAGTAFGIAGLIYLGISLASGGRHQPEIVKAIAMIVAGFTVQLYLAVRSQPLRDLPYVHNCRSLHPHAVRNNGTG